MYQNFILQYAREKNLSPQDAAQTFLQVLVLRHLALPSARFMGGTALVLGYGNPRFSEDVDLTQVGRPHDLERGLLKARAECGAWFACPVTLQAPGSKGRTWRLTVRLGRSDSLRLHIDSQPYRAYTSRPIVLQFPSIPAFVCEALELDEIMAEKVIALAFRRYLGGRDLFDLWFHWLRSEDWKRRREPILDLIKKKLGERSLSFLDLKNLLLSRLSENASLRRAREEWKRYLPADFQKDAVFGDILTRCRRLQEIVT